MINLPDGIVSVHLGNERYRGAYYFRGDKLVLIDMVRASQAIPEWHPELALCGTTTQLCY